MKVSESTVKTIEQAILESGQENGAVQKECPGQTPWRDHTWHENLDN